MANLFQPSLQRATDSNGNPASGAKMFFFLTGTTTAAPWYTDQAGAVPGGNPLLADSSGKFTTPAYLDTNTTYRVRLTAADGVTLLWPDVDPVRGYDESAVQTAANAALASQTAAAASAATANTAIAGAQAAEAAAQTAQTAAETAEAAANTSSTSAAASLTSLQAAMASGSLQSFASTTDALSNGVIGNGAITGGSGGTNGTFTGSLSGGGGTGAAFRFVVSGGAVTQIIWLAKGVGYTSAPTLSFAASSGLSGASATAIIGANTVDGQWFTVVAPTSRQGTLYKNVAAAAVVQYIDTSAVQDMPNTGLSLTAATTQVKGDVTANTADVTSGTFYAWGNAPPTTQGGLLNRVSIRLGATGNGTIFILDMLTQKVLKKVAVTGLIAGQNDFGAATFGAYYIPTGAVVIYSPTSGGYPRTATGTYSAIRYTNSVISALNEGDTATSLGIIATTTVSIEVEVLYIPQSLNHRLNNTETNALAEEASFVDRDGPVVQRNVGITADNSGATTASAANRIHLTPEMSRGGKLISMFFKMSAAGSGFATIWRKTGNVGGVASYKLAKTIPVTLNAGANTVAVSETVYLPKGSRFGYYPVTGGVLTTPGVPGRLAEYISTTGFTGAIGYVGTLATAAAYGQVGCVVEGPASAEVMTARASTLKLVDNSRPRPRLPTFFVKGIWLQPASTHATWKARGVNTLMHDYADAAGDVGSDWLASAVSNGLYYNRRPGLSSLEAATPAGQISGAAQLAQVTADCQYDAVSSLCIGWSTAGEPDNAPPWEQGVNVIPNAQTVNYLEREIARWKAVDPYIPVWMGVEGFHTKQPSANQRWFLNARGVDVFGFDDYPNYESGVSRNIWWHHWTNSATYSDMFSTVNGCCAEWHTQKDFPSYANLGPTLSGGKATFCYVATSRVESGGRVPTPGEFRALCWSPIIHGVIGIGYFPQDVTTGAFVTDASDANVLTEMTTLHTNIAYMESKGLLIDGVFGGRVPFTKRTSPALMNTLPSTDISDPGIAFQSPLGSQLQGGFEAMEVVSPVDGKTYRLILNLIGSNETLTDTQWGYSAWAFTPYEAKLIETTNPTTNLFSESGL
jgi:hypothetical protein